MLAPEDESRALDALRFSLASDIVELLVLTADEVFLQTLREAVGAARRLWHVPSADKVSDLLVAGGVGILVLDVQALHEAANVFITEIKRQFPDLVVVVAGNRDTETSLARLISDGIVYRFIHKPLSPGRARLFADAAVKKYDEQRKRVGGPTAALAAPTGRGLKIGAAFAAATVVLAAIWLVRHETQDAPGPQPTAKSAVPASDSPQLLARAAQALSANRLTAPSGDNALELYRQALTSNPSDADARAGLAEVHERLLARAENALLEERLDEASAAIETASDAGVERGRIAFLSAQLAKARERLKTRPAPLHAKETQGPLDARPADARPADARPADASRADVRPPDTRPLGGPPPPERAEQLAALATQRLNDGHLIEPEKDNARFYVQQALRADPSSSAAEQAQRSLALALLAAARNAIGRREFARSASLIDSVEGLAAPANIDNLKQLLASARRQADADGNGQLLKSAQERLQQDRLLEPPNDSAAYYVSTLRGVDPANAGLAAVTSDLGARLVAKGRRALALEQYDAARSWLDAAASIGYSSPESTAAARDLESALARQRFQANVVNASELALVKSVQPVYPRKAEEKAVEGWVEIEFTVGELGEVKDPVIRAANPPGMFDQAAVGALSQWRYKPVLRDAKPVLQRARIRIRFTLAR